MKQLCRRLAVLSLSACIPLAGCKQAPQDVDEPKSATVEHLEGAEPARITLTEEAAARLQLKTAPVVQKEMNGRQQMAIPYDALLYDTDGKTWTYINPSPLVFVRHPIVVDQIAGDLAFLSEGLEMGISVVTVGAAELYGAEIEFEEE